MKSTGCLEIFKKEESRIVMSRIKKICNFMSSNIAVLIIVFSVIAFFLPEGLFLGHELHDAVSGSGHVRYGSDD